MFNQGVFRRIVLPQLADRSPCPGKEDTFVLDFVNKAEDIRTAFEPYYDATTIEEVTDPNRIYDLRSRLDGFQVYTQEEVDAAYAALVGRDSKRSPASAALNAAVDPGRTRFVGLDPDDQEQFRHLLTEFTRLYSFLLNVLPYRDRDLERFYEYARFLLRKLPKRELTDAFPIEEYVDLSRYRLRVRESGPIALGEEGESYALPGFGEAGAVHPADQIKQSLSALIAAVNERFGADLTDEDSLTFSQVEEQLVANGRLAEQARANDEEHYAVGFDDAWEAAAIEVLLRNQALFARLQQNQAFAEVVKAHIRPRVYRRQRGSGGG
jgi:type I restriction enzyme, R subunit